MARYVERAENTARMLDVNLSTSLLPQSAHALELSWRALLSISELTAEFDERYPIVSPRDVIDFMVRDTGNPSSIASCLKAARDVIDFMVRDTGNPSSIASCLKAARENARAVRGSLTTEVWETYNDTWLELRVKLADRLSARDPQAFFEWVKFRSHLSRGVTIGTMLKDEAFYFVRLGTFLERADNTARLIDIKYHGIEEGAGEEQGGEHPPDFYHWAALLRSVSAFETYRKVYRDVITPSRVAELLILRGDMPRSLASCVNEVSVNLEMVRNSRSNETERRAGLLRAELRYGRIQDILARGLHAYLTEFLERINDLGGRISEDFLLPLENKETPRKLERPGVAARSVTA